MKNDMDKKMKYEELEQGYKTRGDIMRKLRDQADHTNQQLIRETKDELEELEAKARRIRYRLVDVMLRMEHHI